MANKLRTLGFLISLFLMHALAVQPLAASIDEVWFSPPSWSPDFFNLFTNPEKWSSARSKIRVFKFHADVIVDPQIEAKNKAFALSKLKQWGMDTAVEVQVFPYYLGFSDPKRCDMQVPLNNKVGSAIQIVNQNGGSLRYIAMDEPLYYGYFFNNSDATRRIPGATLFCGLTVDQTASKTAEYINEIKAIYPDVIIGDIEPYPALSIDEMKSFVIALENKGVRLPFFHLDIFVYAIPNKEKAASDLRELKSFLEARGIRFGIIFGGQGASAGKISADTDKEFYENTIALIKEVKTAIGRPPQSVFQSWTSNQQGAGIPINLPEDDPSIYSHTRLINDGMAILGPAPQVGPPKPLGQDLSHAR